MDEIQVINSALGLLRDKAIVSLNEGTERARLAGLRYALVRDSVLEKHPWNFAMVRVALAASPTAPTMDWGYQFVLPADPYCLKVRRTSQAAQAWEVGLDQSSRRVLLANDSSINIAYTARVTDLTIWTPLAVLALTYLLASDFAGPLTGSAQKTQQWQQAFLWAMEQAQLADGQEGSPRIVAAPTTLTSIR